ncbi:uncharacterized protein C9orf85 homolog [Planococcus citri]|uniref:uncharacterized protein C9orf85 homolog n=1 Tax=Planococcus citri TaxID=170843 RepID=UPI0031F8ED40
MSSQRGNISRTRPQKHQNRKVFKNDLHDTNIRTKRINQTQITHVCAKCKSILEWKIKYKKYKMIKAAKTCNKCSLKAIKMPYHTVCIPCAQKLSICPKCEVHISREDIQKDDPSDNCDNINEQDFDDPDVDSDLSDDDLSDTDLIEDLSELKIKR